MTTNFKHVAILVIAQLRNVSLVYYAATFSYIKQDNYYNIN